MSFFEQTRSSFITWEEGNVGKCARQTRSKAECPFPCIFSSIPLKIRARAWILALFMAYISHFDFIGHFAALRVWPAFKVLGSRDLAPRCAVGFAALLCKASFLAHSASGKQAFLGRVRSKGPLRG